MTDYGSDVSTFVGGDLDPSFALRTGPHVVAEAIARRLMTPRGGLFYDPQYGFDLRQLLNDAIPAARLGVIAAQIETEALKDERVQAATVSVTQNLLVQSLAIKVLLTLAGGPFAFTLIITTTSQQLIFGK